jgi:hypothetical protein
MSRPNKVNKNNYTQRGRLTPDEMAHERMKQGEISGRAKGKENVIGKIPTRPAGPESSPGNEKVMGKTPTRPAGRGSSRPRNEREE